MSADLTLASYRSNRRRQKEQDGGLRVGRPNTTGCRRLSLVTGSMGAANAQPLAFADDLFRLLVVLAEPSNYDLSFRPGLNPLGDLVARASGSRPKFWSKTQTQ